MGCKKNVEKGKISVIVPIFNSEETLASTIESIINQSYDNLEIILVNDGSVDSSLEICERYQNVDDRIIVINKSNSGVGESRNRGLDVASGEFIAFVDSDDTLDMNYFETLYNTAELTGAQIVESGAKVVLSETEVIYPYEKPDKIILCDNKEYMKNYLNFSFNVSVWGKIYRRDLIGEIRFPQLNINEDFIFLWEIVKRTQLCCENLNTNYHYYLDKENSLSKTPFSHNHMTMLTHLNQVVADVIDIAPELLKEAQNHYSACLLHTLVLYYQYINSDNCNDYYLEDKNDLIDATKKMIPITSYLLLHESQYDVDELIDSIEEKTRRKSL